MILLYTGNFSTAQTTGALGLDALGAGLAAHGLHGAADGLLHGTAEGYTTLQLGSNVLGDQLSVLIGALYLDHAQGQYGQLLGLALVYQGLALGTQFLYLRAALTDNDTGTGTVDVNANLIGGSTAFDIGPGPHM